MFCLIALIISIIELIDLIKEKRKFLFVCYIFILLIGTLLYFLRDHIPSFASFILKLFGDKYE